jgi:short-subunit dehydrogenase
MAAEASRSFAVVTGASSGIGRELALQFAQNGFDVLINAEDDGIHAAAAELAATGAHVEAVQADLATYEGVERLAAAVQSSGRRLDAVALNAGIGVAGPYYATYAASKAFVLSFAQALRYEVKDAGVSVTALMPGPTDTEFFERAGLEDTPIGSAPKDDPAEVAKDGFEALMAGKDHVVAGSAKNKLQTASGKLLPEPAKAAVHARMTRPPEESG